MKLKYYIVLILIMMIVFLTGCNNESKQQFQSIISVYGTGTVLVQPDIIQMSITLSNVAQTTRTAQEEVNRMVRQALTILKNEGIEDKNISTASLTFFSEYEYTTRRILIGQRAEQRITFTIENINIDNERVSRIIDQLIGINGIELNQVNFSVKDSTDYFIRSRALAFEKAVEKATQYAELSNLRIIKVSSISEEGFQQISPVQNRFTNQIYEAASADAAGSTILPTGELEITSRILVEFILE